MSALLPLDNSMKLSEVYIALYESFWLLVISTTFCMVSGSFWLIVGKEITYSEKYHNHLFATTYLYVSCYGIIGIIIYALPKLILKCRKRFNYNNDSDCDFIRKYNHV